MRNYREFKNQLHALLPTQSVIMSHLIFFSIHSTGCLFEPKLISSWLRYVITLFVAHTLPPCLFTVFFHEDTFILQQTTLSYACQKFAPRGLVSPISLMLDPNFRTCCYSQFIPFSLFQVSRGHYRKIPLAVAPFLLYSSVVYACVCLMREKISAIILLSSLSVVFLVI